MAPLEPHEKVLVSEEFLTTSHGELACTDCHGGNSQTSDKAEAHTGFEPHPSIKSPEKSCGECHEQETSAKDSLHATLSTFPTILKTRADMDKWHEIDEARKGHCAGCHTSCGGCHVSRPKFAKKGFVNGHVFQKHTDPINQCTACHGSRVGHEYYGSRGQGDVHVAQYNMDCVSCHKAKEMHAAAPAGLAGRYHLNEMVRCEDCHAELYQGSIREHTLHIGKVQCQVCHSQTYVNCYSCHTGKDSEGVRYFQNQKEVESLKIGMNYDKDAPKSFYEYMLVRHEPSDLEVFDFYVKDAFTNFGNTPTWKRTSPHNIQRKTWQTASCNNCHGNKELFLSNADLLDYEKTANQKVIVPEDRIPAPRKHAYELKIDTSKVRSSMVVDAHWVHEHGSSGKVVLVDARSKGAYDKGHIKGAVHFDPLKTGLRKASDDDDNPLELVGEKTLTGILGSAGLSADDHIVVYDKNGRLAGFLLFVLEYAGAKSVSYMKGGVEAWHEEGYHFSTDSVSAKAKVWGGTVQKEMVADNEHLSKKLGHSKTVILDARLIHQAKGLTKHGLAEYGGNIPSSINLPLGALYMENGDLKEPDELLWVLKNYGITPERTVVTTCNTGQLAGAAFFMLRYLGFEDVRVHDQSWIGWCSR